MHLLSTCTAHYSGLCRRDDTGTTGCERVTPGGQCDNVGTGRDHGAMVGDGGHSDRDTAQWEQLTPPHGHGHCCSQGWRI